MKIFLGSDHAGFELKNILEEMLRVAGHEVEDVGASTLDPLDDYPDFIFPVARAVARDPSARGIILGASGQGEAMAANRVKGVRAAVFYGPASASPLSLRATGGQGLSFDILKLSREHNDANVLSLGAQFLTGEEAQAAVQLWLATPFSGDERHVRRITKLDQ